MAGEITIERSLEQIQQGIKGIGDASRAIDKDLKAVNAGLRFDPKSVDLLAQKQEILARKLENSKDRSQELSAAITELNRIKAENGQLTDGQAKLLATYEQQLKSTSAEVTGLTGNVEKQIEVNKVATDTTKSFSKSMTEFQSNLTAVKQVMSGVINTYTLLGGDKDSAMYKTLQQGQQVIQVMAGLASMGKLLQNQNILTAGSWGNIALSVGAAVGAYSLVSGLISSLNPDMQRSVGIITAVTGAVTAAAVATLAWKGVLSWGVGIPVMLAAVGAGIAGLKAAVGDATSTSANIGGASASIPSTSSPSVPSYSSGGGASNVTVQTLSHQQIKDAVYEAGTRIVLEQGLNDPKIFEKTSVTKREIQRWIFSGILDPQTGTINAREVL